MKLISADFVTSAVTADGVPQDGLHHVALVGRSNVGKSTLINALARKPIARTSAAPGKTRQANIYRLVLDAGSGGRRGLYLVDLPGYGYARGGPAAAAELAGIADAYFASRAASTITLLLVDARHPGLGSDIQAHRWLDSIGVPARIVATKIDKLSRTERVRTLRELERVFGTAALPVSALRGEGLDALWKVIANPARAGDTATDVTIGTTDTATSARARAAGRPADRAGSRPGNRSRTSPTRR